jgi:hypothetical protein
MVPGWAITRVYYLAQKNQMVGSRRKLKLRLSCWSLIIKVLKGNNVSNF